MKTRSFKHSALMAHLLTLCIAIPAHAENAGIGTDSTNTPMVLRPPHTTNVPVIVFAERADDYEFQDRYLNRVVGRVSYSAQYSVLSRTLSLNNYTPRDVDHLGKSMLLGSMKYSAREFIMYDTQLGDYVRGHGGLFFRLIEGTIGNVDEENIGIASTDYQPYERTWWDRMKSARFQYGLHSDYLYTSCRVTRHGEDVLYTIIRYYPTDHFRSLNSHKFSWLFSVPVYGSIRADVGAECLVKTDENSGSGVLRLWSPMGKKGDGGFISASLNAGSSGHHSFFASCFFRF